MSSSDSEIFDRDTILDLSVNIIPLGILAFFFVLFLVVTPGPFSFDSVLSTIQFAIIITTFILMSVLTYYAGRAIAGAEKRLGKHAETATYDPDADETTETDH